MTNKESFNNLKMNWLRELQAIAPENMVKIVVGNKADLVEEVENSGLNVECVTDKMLRDFAMSKKADYLKVSARKDQASIDEVFQRIGDRLIKQNPLVSCRLECSSNLF